MCLFFVPLPYCLVAYLGKNLPKRSRFDPWVGKIALEEEMATHYSILAWEIPWTEESGGLQSMGSQESDAT